MLNSIAVTTKAEVLTEWRNALVHSIDGRESSVTDVDVASPGCLLHPSWVFPHLYLQGIQLRGGLLSTKSRSARGTSGQVVDRCCRGACRVCETLSHIWQACETTHHARCASHNCVLRQLEQLLRWDRVR